MSKRRKSFFKKSRGSKLFDFTNVVFMLFFCITVIFPVWDMLVLSVSSSENINYLSLNLCLSYGTFLCSRNKHFKEVINENEAILYIM